MGFIWLLFKMLFLMLASAVGGYFLRKWIERSRYKDVTVSYSRAIAKHEAGKIELDNLRSHYQSLQNDVDSKLDGVLGRFSPIEKKLDGVDMSAKLAGVSKKIESMQNQIASLPKAKETDLSPVLGAISSIRIPEAEAPNFDPVMDAILSIHIPEAKTTDLTPVLQAIENIRMPEQSEPDLSPVINAIDSLHIPTPDKPDLSPIISAIEQIRIPEPEKTNLTPVLEAVRSIRIPERRELNTLPLMSAIRNIKIPEQKEPDLAPVLKAIENIQIPESEKVNLAPVLLAIRNINIPETKPTDLTPVLQEIRNIKPQEQRQTDLSPLLSEIRSLKAELAKRPKPVEKKVVQTIVKTVSSQDNKDVIANRLGSRGNRLRKAAFGKADDLKVISGVGPKLEKMLHGIGVYYYWQVADWTKADVDEADDLLDAFKGRIERDDWVAQAGKLAKLPTAAKRP